MNQITVNVPNTDACTDSSYEATVDKSEAIAAGCKFLSAVEVDGEYYYWAEETDEVYEITEEELCECGAGQIDERGFDYSLWCSSTGGLVENPSEQILEALGR